MDLKFKIENQILLRADNNKIVNKSRDYLYCKFEFITDEWLNKEKFAIFLDKRGNAYNIPLGTGNICSCLVPADVLKYKFFRLSIYGGNLITTNKVTIAMLKSGYTTDYKNPKAEEIDAFNDLYTKINSKIDNIEYEDGLIKIYVDKKLVKTVDLAYDDLEQNLMQVMRSELNEKLTDYVRFDGISFDEGILKFE